MIDGDKRSETLNNLCNGFSHEDDASNVFDSENRSEKVPQKTHNIIIEQHGMILYLR